MRYTVAAAPTTEPVLLSDVKIHLRTVTGDTSEDSAIITPLIQAAREYCENITGRALATQTVKAYPEGWRTWRLPRPPITSITSIQYYDTDNTEYTLSTDDYQIDFVGGEIEILHKPDVSLRNLNPIEVEYVCGYATDLPKAIRQAMLLLIAHWYENREAVVIGATGAEVDLTVHRLLSQYKVWWFHD